MTTVNINPLPFTPSKSDPNFIDALKLLKKDILLNLNCHHVATLQAFNPENQTATATVNYKKTSFQYNSKTATYNAVLTDYPLLLNCPVFVLGGGPANLTFPFEQGDECLALLNDRDIDNWFQGAGNGATNSARLHSFSDGLLLVGIRSLPNTLDGYDMTRAALNYGTTTVAVGESLVRIANATYTLNTLLQDLVTQIKDLVTATAAITVGGVTTGGGTSGTPTNATTITNIGTQLTTIATHIGDLLE